jgi:signal transduction histidine kinase
MGIRERVRFLGGSVNILGISGKGTTVIISVPCEGRKDRTAAHP